MLSNLEHISCSCRNTKFSFPGALEFPAEAAGGERAQCDSGEDVSSWPCCGIPPQTGVFDFLSILQHVLCFCEKQNFPFQARSSSPRRLRGGKERGTIAEGVCLPGPAPGLLPAQVLLMLF